MFDPRTTQDERDDWNETPELQLFKAISHKEFDRFKRIIEENPSVNLNCTDKDDLTPLQHLASMGNIDTMRFLLDHGADVDFTRRKDRYTALMFAAVTNKIDAVRLLVERGANRELKNCVNRTAADMAQFVSQHQIVNVIRFYVPYESTIEPYTRCLPLEDEPRIPSESLGQLLYQYLILPESHPIKFMQYLKRHHELLEHGSQCLFVLEHLASKNYKKREPDEPFAFKTCYIAYIFEHCLKKLEEQGVAKTGKTLDLKEYHKIMDSLMRDLIRCKGPAIHGTFDRKNVTKFIMQMLMKFPYQNSESYKAISFSFQQFFRVKDEYQLDDSQVRIHINQVIGFCETYGHKGNACIICEHNKDTKLCGGCKSLYYCGPDCQNIDWFQHRKSCQRKETPSDLKTKT